MTFEYRRAADMGAKGGKIERTGRLVRLAQIGKALTAVSATFASFFGDEAAAQGGETVGKKERS